MFKHTLDVSCMRWGYNSKRWECRERFPRHRVLSIPACITARTWSTHVKHVRWCIPGSITSGFLWSRWRVKRSRHYRHMRNQQFYIFGKRPLATSRCKVIIASNYDVNCKTLLLYTAMFKHALEVSCMGWGYNSTNALEYIFYKVGTQSPSRWH